MNRTYMKYRIFTIILCSIVSVVTFNSVPNNVIAGKLKIGIVDINEIFDNSDMSKDFDHQLKVMETEFK